MLNDSTYQTLLDFVPDAVVVVDASGTIVMLNAQVASMFGYERDALLGENVDVLLPSALRDAHARQRAAYGAGPHVRPMGVGLELFARRRDGSDFPVEISLGPLTLEGSPFVIAVVRDITERKRAQDALRASEERFRLLVDGVQDYAIYMLDPDGRVVSWNAASERIKGYTSEEIVGRHTSEFYQREDVDAGLPAAELALAEASGRCEVQGWRLRKDGTAYLASVVTTAVRDLAGQLRGYSKVVRDVTERQAMEDERNRLRAAAELQSDRDRIAMDLHDGIIQSLYAVGLGLEVALDDAGNAPDVQRQLNASIEQLGRVVQDIRQYIYELRPSRYSGDLLASLRSLAADFRNDDGAQLRLRLPATLPRIDDDQALAILHIAREALTNARKHAAARHVALDLRLDHGELRLTVTDDGQGMENTEYSDEHRGIRNMKLRAELAGGTCTMRSAPGAGTTVMVRLSPDHPSSASPGDIAVNQ
jgi:PAS domain S-box-containing protein